MKGFKRIEIEGKDSHYFINEYGEIYNSKFDRYINPQKSGTTKYRMCSIFIDGKRHRESVHRLVAYSFCNPPKNFKDLQVNHIDGNKMNNHKNNLEWVTPKENIQNQFDSGISKGTPHRSVLCYDLKGALIKEYDSIYQASKELGIGSGNIYQSMCENNNTRYAYDYQFREKGSSKKVYDLTK